MYIYIFFSVLGKGKYHMGYEKLFRFNLITKK